MTTTVAVTQAERPLVTRSRAELERAVIEAARELCERNDIDNSIWPLEVAVADLDEWEQLRAEAAG
ncbi:MAG TPA: hypothetical protein VNM48_10250 [Chloroflexota bacterium]|nr:hypothetical protein [Chloroflexota bacterium]